MILKQAYINAITNYTKDNITSAHYTQGDVEYQATSFTTEVEGNIIKVRIYLDQTVTGSISSVSVKSGNVKWFEQNETFYKPGDRGFYKLIRINVQEVLETI